MFTMLSLHSDEPLAVAAGEAIRKWRYRGDAAPTKREPRPSARLPAAVHVGLIAHRLLPPIRLLASADGYRVSRFSRVKFRCLLGAFDSAVPRRACVGARRCVAFRVAGHRRRYCCGDFGAHQLQGYPACTCPCPTLRVRRFRPTHMAPGQDGSLLLSSMTLSFTTPRRFIPTHPGLQ